MKPSRKQENIASLLSLPPFCAGIYFLSHFTIKAKHLRSWEVLQRIPKARSEPEPSGLSPYKVTSEINTTYTEGLAQDHFNTIVKSLLTCSIKEENAEYLAVCAI